MNEDELKQPMRFLEMLKFIFEFPATLSHTAWSGGDVPAPVELTA